MIGTFVKGKVNMLGVSEACLKGCGVWGCGSSIGERLWQRERHGKGRDGGGRKSVQYFFHHE